MYSIIKNVILSGRYELADTLKKIDTIWLQGALTDEEHTELVALARECADPVNSYAALQDQMAALHKSLADLAARVTTLEGGTADPAPEEYPAYVPPTGAHDAYNTGDKMTYTDGQRYICMVDGCVWGPDVYPDGWNLVEE